MNKQVLTFALGAATGVSAIAFLSREGNGNPYFKQKFPAAAESYVKNYNINKDAENNQGTNKPAGERLKDSINRFIERSSRKPSWENFDIRPQQKWNWDWDRRHYDDYGKVDDTSSAQNSAEPNGSDSKTLSTRTRPTATRHLILIRHGQYNLEGKTDEERILTTLGCDQAEATGERIASLNLPLSYVVSSTMTRAIETADLIRPFLPTDIPSLPNDPILCEGAPFPPEPRSSWKPEKSYHVDGARIEAAFRKYFHRAEVNQQEDSFEVIVCHANVIRYFVCRALQLPPEAWLRITLKHGSMTWFTIRPDGRASIRSLGEAGHMPPNKLTTTWTVTPF
jgi:serine/threonine-protein phosphatase PGAM5